MPNFVKFVENRKLKNQDIKVKVKFKAKKEKKSFSVFVSVFQFWIVLEKQNVFWPGWNLFHSNSFLEQASLQDTNFLMGAYLLEKQKQKQKNKNKKTKTKTNKNKQKQKSKP